MRRMHSRMLRAQPLSRLLGAGMEKSTAFNLVQAVLGSSDRLNEIDAQVRAITDEVKKKELLKALGTIMLELELRFISRTCTRTP